MDGCVGHVFLPCVPEILTFIHKYRTSNFCCFDKAIKITEI
jgi:hypothetical protein